MRAALCLAVAVLAAGCSGSGSGATRAITIRLSITVWPQGPGKRATPWTLRCNPLGGTLPHADRACYELAAAREDLFAPVPPDRACTQVYGGPAVARVVGRVRGRRVDARFSRTDGCQIARWERVRFLFPGVRRES